MKSTSTQEIEAKGVNQRYKAPVNAASNMDGHWSVDPNGGGWSNAKGIEPLIPLDSTVTFDTAKIVSNLQPIRFLSVVTRHNAAEVYYLYERDGSLQYDMGNAGSIGTTRRTSVLDTGRKIPKPDDCGTQLTTYGRFNLIINGYNRMLKWWGRELLSAFGFISPTPSPVLSGVQPDYIIYSDGAIPEAFYRRLENGNTCIRLSKTGYYGLGDPDTGSINRYDYKVSFISDTGSESPLSGSASVIWDLKGITDGPTSSGNRLANGKYYEGKYGVYFSNLPTGPQGTLARRIYRTKNRVDGITGAGEIYYLVRQIDNNADTTYTDITPDQDLNIPAPSVTDSVTISSQWKYCATWNNSIWLAGGEMNPYGIIYSRGGLPEQFSAFSTFDVGMRDGGAITALVPFYDILLVFRERSIELISYNNGGYSISTLDSNVGTTATNTIKLVAGVGVVFLNKDGIFAITGSIRGGAVYQVNKISEPIEKEMSRISLSAMARATATYSEMEKEYWCHYPVDGDTENSRGSVYHTMNAEWSFRYSNGLYSDGNGMPYTQLASDPNGNIIIGLKPTIGSDIFLRRGYPGIGLQVWSASRFSGAYISNPIINQSKTTFDYNTVQKSEDIWESTWNDFGDDSKKKRVLYVELEIITTGENPISLDWATDWGYDFTSSGTQIPLKPETVGTTNTEPSYGTKGGNPAVWSTSKWSQAQVTRLRWDIGTGLCSTFKFRVFSSNLFQVISFQVEAVGSQNKPLNQNGPSSRS